MAKVNIALIICNLSVTQWVVRLTRNVKVVGSNPIKGPVVSLSKKLYLIA